MTISKENCHSTADQRSIVGRPPATCLRIASRFLGSEPTFLRPSTRFGRPALRLHLQPIADSLDQSRCSDLAVSQLRSMVVAGHTNPRPVSLGQTLTLHLGEHVRGRDLEHELCSGVRGVRMLPARTARRPESPHQLGIGKHQSIVDDHAVRPRLVSSHPQTVVVRTTRRDGKEMRGLGPIGPSRGHNVPAKE